MKFPQIEIKPINGDIGEKRKFDAEFYGRIRKTAFAKCFNKSIAEDVAQEVALAFTKNPNSRQTIDQAIIDALRRYGETKFRSGSDACAAVRRKTDEQDFCSSTMDKFQGEGSDLHCASELFDFESSTASLNKMQRIVFVLRTLWGFSEKEIGFACGFTESRASQILSSAQALISRKESSERKRTEQVAVSPNEGRPGLYGAQESFMAKMDRKEKGIRPKLFKDTIFASEALLPGKIKAGSGKAPWTRLQPQVLFTSQRFLDARI